MMSRLIATATLCIFCLNTNAQLYLNPNPPRPKTPVPPAPNEKLEAMVIKTVKQVPEVKDFLMENKYITDPRGHHGLIIDDEPDDRSKYYVVKMGYDRYMFRTLDRFCVDPHTLKVYYWDVLADDVGFSSSAIISLEKWRKYRKTALWNKPHTYKAGKLVALKE